MSNDRSNFRIFRQQSTSFYFSCYQYHRHLHSFPTRRSSDLSRSPAAAPVESARAASSSRFCLRQRSEEHTSELQSQFHLVCRLLLEKKKTFRHNRNLMAKGRKVMASSAAQCEHEFYRYHAAV